MGKGGHREGAGRPKGARNKRTKEVLDRIDKIMAILDETLEEDIKSLKASEKVKTGNDLLEYQVPKLQRTEIKGEITTGPKKIGIKKDVEPE